MQHTASSRRCGRGALLPALAAGLVPLVTAAGPAAQPPSDGLPDILVIGTTPVPGLDIDIDKVPGNVQSVSAAELRQNGAASLIGALGSRLGSISISDALADPFQPDILYRGFEASPVLGTPQGLAVYQNGVRINEAFGDSVNWDLIPDVAIGRVDIVSSSPLYGLNALGGAMAITMKNGFDMGRSETDLSGGSFHQRNGSLEAGGHSEHLGIYAAVRALDQDGWRLFAHDALRQYYLDFTVRAGGTTLDLSYAKADNHLYGPGAAPVQSLAIDPAAVFTGPQANANDLDFLTLNAATALGEALAVQGVLYSRDFRQAVSNGNTSNFVPCTHPVAPAVLCQPDGATPLLTAAATPIPDLTNGGTLSVGQNDFESIHSQTWGGSLQLTSSMPLFGLATRSAVGASVDASHTDFLSGTQVGRIGSDLRVQPSVWYLDTPEGTAFPATPVLLNAGTKYYGIFGTAAIDAGSALTITASGRYNVAQIDLADRRGDELSGRNQFTHFNPALGATYAFSPRLTAFGGYSINNRAPTASEIECSNPLQPCLLPSSLAGDPPLLRQVIAHTLELGVRGHAAGADAHIAWNASLFRTDLDDDIYGVATSVSTGFFRNIGATRRAGLETGLNYQSTRWSLSAQYSFIDATFRSPLVLNSPSNPFAVGGDIRVQPGDRLPGIPRNRCKLGADFEVRPSWSVGATVTAVGGQYYHGDESNQNRELPGYVLAGARTSLHLEPRLEVFINVQNLFDRRYASYGLYGDPTGVGAAGIPPNATSNDPRVDNRFQNPGAPRAVYGGLNMTF